MPQSFARFVFAVTAVFFGVFFVWPMLQILRGGFLDANGHFTTAYLTALLSTPTYLLGLRNAFGLACAATVLALGLALPLAWMQDRFQFPGKPLLGWLILIPMILPPFVGAIGLKQIFGQYGAFNALLHDVGLLAPKSTVDWFALHRFWGIAVVEALSLYPVVYLNAVAALANVDPALEEAAENLGSPAYRRFFRVTLPLIQPGLFAGGTIVFIWAFTELGTPLVFDYDQVTSVQIYEGLKDIGGNPFPYTLVSVMLFASIALYAIGKGLFGRTATRGSAKPAAARSPRPLSPARTWLCTAAFAAITFVAMLPHLGVVLVAFSRDWYATAVPQAWTLGNFRVALGHDLTVPSIANSLRFAGAATGVDLVLGVAIAYVVARSRLASRHALDGLAMLPLAVPGLVLAFGYVAMAQEGRAFAFLDPTKNPTVLLIVAYAIRRLPYVVRAAAAGFEQTSETLEQAAQNLGAPPLKSLFRVTLPLITANLVAGGLLAFAFAVLEVSDSLILAQKQAYYPLTKAILELSALLGDGKFIACALGVWAMVFLALVIASTGVVLRKNVGAVFRL